ncbi:hypothetical protein DRO64_07880 [Candidatus Bathyarchaeota archaeon]|nr:MAG: hypothetical protein DRO64_07880 [Candidatus Bathyarchaeota archaeon]
MSEERSLEPQKDRISRRQFVAGAATAIVSAVVGGIVGSQAFPKTVTETATREVTKISTSTATVSTTIPTTVVSTATKEVTKTETATKEVTTTVTVTPTVEKAPVKNAMLLINPVKCTGCMLCAFACAEHWMKEEHPELAGDTINLEFSRIRPMRFQYVDVVNVCYQCRLEPYAEGSDKHPCEQVCPTGALHTVEGEGKEGYYGNGYLWVDKDMCLGFDACGKCLEVCEEQFGSGISFDPITKKAQVCSMCGGMPVCADACPEGAIEVVVPGRNGRVYAEPPEVKAELYYMKLYGVRRDL